MNIFQWNLNCDEIFSFKEMDLNNVTCIIFAIFFRDSLCSPNPLENADHITIISIVSEEVIRNKMASSVHLLPLRLNV